MKLVKLQICVAISTQPYYMVFIPRLPPAEAHGTHEAPGVNALVVFTQCRSSHIRRSSSPNTISFRENARGKIASQSTKSRGREQFLLLDCWAAASIKYTIVQTPVWLNIPRHSSLAGRLQRRVGRTRRAEAAQSGGGGGAHVVAATISWREGGWEVHFK